MTEIVITYETLYEILRREKFRQELQQLSKTFFEDVLKYIQEKQIILESQKSKDSIFSNESEKTQKQIESIKKILKELYQRRESKIIQLALFSSRLHKQENITVMLPEEKQLYTTIKDTLNLFRKGVLYNLLSNQIPEISINSINTTEPKTLKAEEKVSTKLIKFNHPVPKFIGTDSNTYGPFDQEDIGNLPQEVANLLIKTERAQELK